ncbi:hypothetical protein HN240_02445 [Acinetobacter baumannii]|uniref:hypothetical protein n=1 Tax=Acinetobacter baumannii TaxID=470 RepID=UPI0018979E3C|nr:hypothetical protein [Acinetobacter baumannii]MBF6720467.1 hypothetical protein [Acinetobacter baumannii]
MDNYKIKVKDEAESKEAQELFFELGYVWADTKCQTPMRFTTSCIYSGFEDGELCRDYYDENPNHQQITLPQLRDLVAQSKLKDQGLISGAEAKLAWANGVDIQIKNVNCVNWYDLDESKYNLDIFDNVRVDFRLKPQTIKLELELPKPFEPEEDCHVYILDDGKTDGYRRYFYEVHGDKGNEFIGIWKTEDEIKQVVAQLRKIRGTNS